MVTTTWKLWSVPLLKCMALEAQAKWHEWWNRSTKCGFEVGFLQPTHSTDQETYFHFRVSSTTRPVLKVTFTTTPTYNASPNTKLVALVPGVLLRTVWSWIIRRHALNELNLAQLYTHIRRKVYTCLIHNMYEIILYVLYNDKFLHMFPAIHNPCNSSNPIDTPVLILRGESTTTGLIRYRSYGNN